MSNKGDKALKEYFIEQAKFYEDKLHDYLKEKENPQKLIYKAMEYSLFAGGKRLRPVLMGEVCKMCGGVIEDTVPFAVALEMIHTYSLIHDDLPAMDNDDLRRGMPTNHIKFGEANAILAGDALLNRAFEITSEVKNIPADIVLKTMHTIAASSGTEGMIGGQIVDIESENKEISLDELKYIHSLKTGAIIRSACTAGAILAGADEDRIKSVDNFAVNLGIAFQIQDDILDVKGTEETLGKPVGSDEKSGKSTYVSICGEKKAYELMIEHSNKAKEALGIFCEKAEFLKWLTEYLISRNN